MRNSSMHIAICMMFLGCSSKPPPPWDNIKKSTDTPKKEEVYNQIGRLKEMGVEILGTWEWNYDTSVKSSAICNNGKTVFFTDRNSVIGKLDLDILFPERVEVFLSEKNVLIHKVAGWDEKELLVVWQESPLDTQPETKKRLGMYNYKTGLLKPISTNEEPTSPTKRTERDCLRYVSERGEIRKICDDREIVEYRDRYLSVVFSEPGLPGIALFSNNLENKKGEYAGSIDRLVMLKDSTIEILYDRMIYRPVGVSSKSEKYAKKGEMYDSLNQVRKPGGGIFRLEDKNWRLFWQEPKSGINHAQIEDNRLFIVTGWEDWTIAFLGDLGSVAVAPENLIPGAKKPVVPSQK